MGSVSAFEVLDRLAQLGCAVRLEGERLKVRGPDVPEVPPLVSELRARRAEAVAILREQQSKPPTLEEVKAALPAGVRLVSWNLKDPPAAIETCAVVTDPALFARSTLEQLRVALENPKRWVGWSVPQLIDRLAQVGAIVALK